MAVTGPTTGYQYQNTQTGYVTDLGNYFVSKDYMLDVYPNLVPGRTSPGLYAWGENFWGEMGVDNRVKYSSPVQVGALTNWRQVSCGYRRTTSAIKTDGTLWTWGYNGPGALGVNVPNINVHYSSPVQVGSLNNWKRVTSGWYQAAAIKTNGTLWMWGDNFNGVGNLGTGVNTRVYYSSPVQVGSLTNWRQVELGCYSTLAIKTDGTLWVWGRNDEGALGLNNQANYSSPVQVGALTNWKQISTFAYHVAAVKTDGTLWTWGYNSNGELGLNNIIRYSSPVQVGSLTTWKSVSASAYNTFALKTDGTLWAWGQNYDGQLGLGDTIDRSSPVQIGSMTNWKTAACGYTPGYVAIKTDGTMWAWGSNWYGALGNGTVNISYSSPIQVGSLTSWKHVACGYSVVAIADGYL